MSRISSLLIITFFVLISCKQEKQVEPAVEKELVVDNTSVKACFQSKTDKGVVWAELDIDDGKLVGVLSIDRPEETIANGQLVGIERAGEFITDLVYEIENQTFEEKVLITVGSESINLARSGTVIIEGERTERNEGMGSLDVLREISCD